MKISPLLSLAAVLAVPAGATDDRATYDFDAVASANKKKNNLRRAAAEKSVYIVSFNAKTTGPAARCSSLANAHGGSAVRTYANVLNGGCALELTAGAAKALEQRAEVAFVEEDMEVTLFEDRWQVPATGQWGLDRVNQCNDPDSPNNWRDYWATKQDAQPAGGAKTKVYIIDTGIRGSHNDFVGMVGNDCHADFNSGEGQQLQDGNGHGTHVASTACGHTYGVAKNCDVCAVKVLSDSGSGSTSGVIGGISFAASNCADGENCVANLSLGGGASNALDDAVADAVAAGVVVVVAAGNSNANACNYSPARATEAITVGSTGETINNVFYPDTRSSFSNYGTCLDFFAPGRDIMAAWIGGANTSTRSISGTSMASPHVAGIAAGILGRMPGSTPAEVRDELLRIGEEGVVSDARTGSPNEFASTCNLPTVPTTGTPTKAPTTPAPVPPTPAPVQTPCSETGFWKNCPLSRCKLIRNKGDKCCVETNENSCPTR